jgi:hypothetical protein
MLSILTMVPVVAWLRFKQLRFSFPHFRFLDMFDFLLSQSRYRSSLCSKMTTQRSVENLAQHLEQHSVQYSVQHSVSLPLIDRLMIMDQAIVESPCRSLEESPEIQFVSRDVEQFTHRLVQREADVMPLTGPVMTLDRLEGMLGIQRLRSEHLDVGMPRMSGGS